MNTISSGWAIITVFGFLVIILTVHNGLIST